jgi:hypothetical protein
VFLSARARGRVDARVALLIRHATRMRHIVSSFVASLAPSYFSTLSHKRHDFRKKKKLLNIKCVLIFSANLSETFLTLRIIQQDIVINVKTFSCKVPDILVGFQ